MPIKKSKAQLEAELYALKRSRVAEGIVQVLLSLIRWGSVIFIARYGYLSIEVLAGKITLADIGVKFFGSIKVSVALAWGAGVGGVTYGLRQKKLRKNNIERLQNRIRFLEAQIDPNRTSSNLTSRGDTRPEDKL